MNRYTYSINRTTWCVYRVGSKSKKFVCRGVADSLEEAHEQALATIGVCLMEDILDVTQESRKLSLQFRALTGERKRIKFAQKRLKNDRTRNAERIGRAPYTL